LYCLEEGQATSSGCETAAAGQATYSHLQRHYQGFTHIIMTQETFSYSAQPHAAPVKASLNNRPKYRDEEDKAQQKTKNLMYDSRIIRGSTYGHQQTSQEKENEPAWKRTTRRDPGKRKFVGKRGSTPPPVEGRSHMDIQTEEFLEELTDRPIQIDMESQTLPFADRPPSPLFVRAKIGHDVETQIGDGDLFDFDLEVEPILEVLIGKTLHVAMLETLQEEELEAIRIQQEEYEAIRNVELQEVQRLQAELRRKQDEKERRIAQEKKRVEERKQLEEKIAARSFAQQYLGQLHISVFEMLEAEGAFYDPVQREIEEIFMVDVVSAVTKQVTAYEAAREMADELLEAVRIRSKAFETEAIRMRTEYLAQLARDEELAREAARLKAEEMARLAAEADARENGEQEESEDL
jgi:radial spoke head protein 3